MEANSIQILIVKYVTNSISSHEIDELEARLHDPANEKQFREFVRMKYFFDYNMKEFNTEEAKKEILNKIRKDKKVIIRGKFTKIFKYAAIAIFFLGSGYLIKQGLDNVSMEQTIVPKDSFITLEMGNGTIKVISEDGSSIIKNSKGDVIGSQRGDKIVYGSKSQTEEPNYNTLHVPYGKKFKLELSDSTIIYLNAGSTIKYPVVFVKGLQREVFLTGEAFFEVAKDVERPFVVNSGNLNIKVLGTKFNVSTYMEDKVKEVVLVEGSVELYGDHKKKGVEGTTMLMPGMKGDYDSDLGKISTEQVMTSIYTSWVDGELVFRNMIFEEILRKLERHYDVTIINKNTKFSKVEFNASFSDMPIGQIMGYFKSIYGIDFTVENDKIIIE